MNEFIQQGYPKITNVVSIDSLDDNLGSDRYVIQTRFGRCLVASKFLCTIIRLMDGSNSIQAIVKKCNEEHGIPLTEESFCQAIDEKLKPYGLLQGVKGTKEGFGGRGFTFLRMTLLPRKWVRTIAVCFKGFFSPQVMCTFTIVSLIAHLFFYLIYSPSRTFEELKVYYQNILLYLILIGFVHELGHASACKYFDLDPGPIGCGVYYVFPVFWTDLNLAWRLPRKQRVVVDIGGVYFQLLLCIPIIIVSGIVRHKWLASLVLFIDMMILYNILPFVRLDGYWFLSDMLGVPNLRSEITKSIKRLVRLQRPEIHDKIQGISRILFYCYLTIWLIVLPFMLYWVSSVLIALTFSYPATVKSFVSNLSTFSSPGFVILKMQQGLRIIVLPLIYIAVLLRFCLRRIRVLFAVPILINSLFTKARVSLLQDKRQLS